jgi:hypothetical protein
MELQHEQTTQINIKNMMTDVHSVIENHFNKMLSELNEKNKDMLTTYNLLQNLPIIKKLEIKLNKANNDIDLLKSGFAEFKDGFNKKDIKDSNMKLNTIELDNGKSVSIIEIEHLVSDAVQKKEITEYQGYAYVGIDVSDEDSDNEDILSNSHDSVDTEIQNCINSEEKQEWNEYSSLLTNKLHISEWKESVVPGVEKVTENEYMATKMVDGTNVVIGTYYTERKAMEAIANSKNVNQTEKLEVDKNMEVKEEVAEDEEVDEDEVEEDEEVDEDEVEEEDEEVEDEVEEEDEEVEEDEEEEEVEEEEEYEEVEEDEEEVEEEAEEEKEVEEDEEEEEVEEEEEYEEVEEDEVEEDEEEEDEESDEEEEVEEIKIKGVKYYATDSKNGILYEFMEDGDIGDEIGHLKNGAVFFS